MVKAQKAHKPRLEGAVKEYITWNLLAQALL